MINTIIFDMDGVLIDSEHIFREVEKEMFYELDIEYKDEEMDAYVGRTGFEFWRDMLEKNGIKHITVEKALKENVDRYIEKLNGKKDIAPIEGVLDWIKDFKNHNKNLVIASSSPRRIIDLVIEKLQIHRYFSNTVAGDSVKNGKPHPEIFLKVAAIFDAKPQECLVIEDSENGIKAAKAAGMNCIGYQNKNSGNQNHNLADYSIKEFSVEALEDVKKLFTL